MPLPELFNEALSLLDRRLSLAGSPCFRLVVCGGTALIAMGLHERTTRDVDIVALADDDGRLIDLPHSPWRSYERPARWRTISACRKTG
jgi:hypothetical protein